MEAQPTLSTRLAELDMQIKQAKEKLRLQHALYAEHGPSLDELAARYAKLDQMLEREVANEESHGHHVSQLEQAVRAWMNHMNFDL